MADYSRVRHAILALFVLACAGCGAAQDNRAPTITSGPTAARTVLAVGEEVSVSVTAADPDGDPLTYSWTANGGAFTAGQNASQAVWRAPAAITGDSQVFALTVTVRDGRGGEAQGVEEITVRPAGNIIGTIQ